MGLSVVGSNLWSGISAVVSMEELKEKEDLSLSDVAQAALNTVVIFTSTAILTATLLTGASTGMLPMVGGVCAAASAFIGARNREDRSSIENEQKVSPRMNHKTVKPAITKTRRRR